jgi:ubiquinone/menaquinone biosynthesis C-methylase UbiE
VSQWTSADAGRQYDDARPPWPVAVEDFLRSVAPPGGWEIAIDLAAGTGRLTERVAAVAATVIAIEPSAAMRAVLAVRVPTARLIAGSAEAMPVPDRSADLVVAGNAFHWFDPESAAAEIERVLRPDGVVGALWHVTEWPEWFAELSSLLADYRNPVSDAAGERAASGGWRRGLEARFGSLTTTAISTHEHAWSRDAFTDVMGSASYIAALQAPRRDEALALVRGFLEDTPQPIVVPHRLEATWARRAGPGASSA